MEDTNSYTKYQQQNQATIPTKFYSHFLCKALIVTIFLVILPLFPSQAPEFINQTLNTRGWEFLHLIFVGSSVFDDEADSPSRSDGSTVQTWNNQYYRNDPVVVVADENSVLDQERRATSSRVGEKPLLLPVRSLKSRVFETDVKSRNGEFGGSHHQDLEEMLKDNMVLLSPIPWKSRSGRMEMKETKEEADSPDLYTLPPSMEESEFNRSFRAQVSRSPRPDSTNSSPKLSPSPSISSPRKLSPQPNSTNSSPKLSPSPSISSPKKLSPSPSFPAEAQGRSAEDFVRKKLLQVSSTPSSTTTTTIASDSKITVNETEFQCH
ncbi:hypothetical protein GH714_038079 [Hevea brasiliensis]|uniref:Uncharacterized protein n=1 Tax=Hevea brasiliensis TaxID=3981 RepID=A0A6A6MPA0_HEVBR|nr:hypothetical protein GH714_038079 [Hevea brasiliensis]